MNWLTKRSVLFRFRYSTSGASNIRANFLSKAVGVYGNAQKVSLDSMRRNDKDYFRGADLNVVNV